MHLKIERHSKNGHCNSSSLHEQEKEKDSVFCKKIIPWWVQYNKLKNGSKSPYKMS